MSLNQLNLSRRNFGRGLLGLALAKSASAFSQVSPAAPDSAAVARAKAALPELSNYVKEGMRAWQIPGAAVGVVVADEVVMAEGFGLRESTGSAPVDAQTVFSIGSTTKAFTATMEAIVVDRGKMSWSDRVVDHFPSFRLADPWVTREFQIIDLLAQRSGLRPYLFDAMWAFGFTAHDLIAALQYARPIGSFRADFAYQNILQSVAGQIIAKHVDTDSWNQALAKLILQPLNMRRAGSSLEDLAAASNHASGHLLIDNKPTPVVPPMAFNRTGPAGSIVLSIEDMVNWLRMLTSRGRFEGQQIVSEANLTETWRPRVQLDRDPRFPAAGVWYASGWVFQLLPGARLLSHNGGGPLVKSHVAILPELGIGFAMLTNEGDNRLPESTGYWFYDRVLGNPDQDWSKLSQTAMMKQRADFDKARPATARAQSPANSEEYYGRYSHPAFGEIELLTVNGALQIAFRKTGYFCPLWCWAEDTFRIGSGRPDCVALLGDDYSPILISAARGTDGVVNQLSISSAPGSEEDLRFERLKG